MKAPRARYLNVQPCGGGFLLSDPYGISAQVVVAPQMLLLLSLMDGKRSEEDIGVFPPARGKEEESARRRHQGTLLCR